MYVGTWVVRVWVIFLLVCGEKDRRNGGRETKEPTTTTIKNLPYIRLTAPVYGLHCPLSCCRYGFLCINHGLQFTWMYQRTDFTARVSQMRAAWHASGVFLFTGLFQEELQHPQTSARTCQANHWRPGVGYVEHAVIFKKFDSQFHILIFTFLTVS